MQLAAFIRANRAEIVSKWEAYAATCPPAEAMDRHELRDDIAGMLDFIASDLDKPLTSGQQARKSKNPRPTESRAAEAHAQQRFRKGFETLEMVSEFRVLRTTIVEMWGPSCEADKEAIKELVQFNAVIDQLMAESLAKYVENEKHARSLFLGTLIHDMKTPLNAILNAVELLLMKETDDDVAMLVSMVGRSSRRISRLVAELIDAVRIRLGKGIPIAPVVSHIGEIAKGVIDEIKMNNPASNITIETSGDLVGEWDSVRVGQLVSNLVGNAVQHGGSSAEVSVSLKGDENSVAINVHDTGAPIAEDVLSSIFDPLARGGALLQASAGTGSLGLALFIANEIVNAHNGSINAASTDKGTTFTARLPKKFTGKIVPEEITEDVRDGQASIH